MIKHAKANHICAHFSLVSLTHSTDLCESSQGLHATRVFLMKMAEKRAQEKQEEGSQ